MGGYEEDREEEGGWEGGEGEGGKQKKERKNDFMDHLKLNHGKTDFLSSNFMSHRIWQTVHLFNDLIKLCATHKKKIYGRKKEKKKRKKKFLKKKKKIYYFKWAKFLGRALPPS